MAERKQTKAKEISALRDAYPRSFLPMLTALGFLVATRVVLWQDAAVAAGGGAVVAVWMLWPLTPWMQHRYGRRR